MSNIDKQAYRADGGDIGTGRIREIADNPYGDEEKCWLAKRMLALLDELEAKDKRVAELEVPTHELKMAHLINKFYERYPPDEFKSDMERSAALGYFMAGAELQCFGEFINYAELMGDE